MSIQFLRPLVAVAMLALPTVTFADEDTSSQESGSQEGGPLSAMAAALDVPESVAAACMSAPLLVAVETHPDLADITACMKETNAGLTESLVNSMWREFGPEFQ